MGVFNSSTKIEGDISSSDTRTITMKSSYRISSIADSIDSAIFKKVVDGLSEKIVFDLYPELINKIDKDTIIREVSIRTSENVLAKMFGDKDGK